jgi:hypothetical protein
MMGIWGSVALGTFERLKKTSQSYPIQGRGGRSLFSSLVDRKGSTVLIDLEVRDLASNLGCPSPEFSIFCSQLLNRVISAPGLAAFMKILTVFINPGCKLRSPGEL